MTFPRPPRTSAANVSLGAVGGPRGVSAGALRLLVEFVSTYDGAAVKQLESDLASLDSQVSRISAKQVSLTNAHTAAQERAAKANKILRAAITGIDDPKGRAEAERQRKDIEANLQGTSRQRKIARDDLKVLVADLVRSGALTKAEGVEVGKIVKLRAVEKGLQTQLTNAEAKRLGLIKEQGDTQKQLTGFQKLKAELPQRLGGLAVGAIGGIVGGLVVGAGFAAVEAVINTVGNAIQDLIDPARHAREEIKDLAAQISKTAQDEDISRIEALDKVLGQLGISADDNTKRLLLEAAGISQANTSVEERAKAIDSLVHAEEIRKRTISDIVNQDADLAREEGHVVEKYSARGRVQIKTIDGQNALSVATQEYEAILQAILIAEQADTFAKNQQRAATYALAAAQESLNAAASAYVSRQTALIDTQIDAVRGAGDSSATQSIQAQIDALSGGGDSGNSQQLANLAEQRAIILLQQKLRLMGTEINLEEYEGKFLLAAIEAKIAAMQKEAAAQDRLNKLLDIQFKMSQGIKRAQGETINDFLERRAQESRDLLSQQRDLEREAELEKLNDQKQDVEDQVKLAEIAEQEKTIAAQAGTAARLKELQKELEASKKSDAEKLKAIIANLELQKKKIQEGADAALKATSEENLLELQNYIKLNSTIEGLAAIGGKIRGLYAAQEFMKALLDSGVLTPDQYLAVQKALAGITSTLNVLSYAKAYEINSGTRQLNTVSRMAGGGLIPLNNSRNPFGGNLQFGEEGSEFGLILNNKITQAIKGMGGGLNIAEFVINRSDDPYRDRYAFREELKDLIREELGQ